MYQPHPSTVCPKCGYGTLVTKDGFSICIREECNYDSRTENSESGKAATEPAKTTAV